MGLGVLTLQGLNPSSVETQILVQSIKLLKNRSQTVLATTLKSACLSTSLPLSESMRNKHGISMNQPISMNAPINKVFQVRPVEHKKYEIVLTAHARWVGAGS